jgi:hypothetical protein
VTAALLSALLPGAGQIYAGRRARGLALLLGLPLQALLFLAVGLPLLCFWLVPIWLWNVADASAAARGRPLSPAPPILLLVLLNFAAGWSITEIRLSDLARGLPRMVPILRGLLQPDLIERAHATQRATANITILAGRSVSHRGNTSARGFFHHGDTEARRTAHGEEQSVGAPLVGALSRRRSGTGPPQGVPRQPFSVSPCLRGEKMSPPTRRSGWTVPGRPGS